MFYSFFATCKTLNINPYHWLANVINRIPERKANKIFELLPQNWKKKICSLRDAYLEKRNLFSSKFMLSKAKFPLKIIRFPSFLRISFAYESTLLKKATKLTKLKNVLK